jgi:hypothetical protein
MDVYRLLEQVFRDRKAFYSDVQKGVNPVRHSLWAAVVWAAALAIFGAVMGVPGGVYYMLASAIKLPLLVAVVTLATLPLLYFFALYSGVPLSVYQTLLLMSGMLVIASVLALAFAPALLALWISVGHYGLYKVACAAVLGLCGTLGILFAKQGLDRMGKAPSRVRDTLFWVWAAVYALVGGQVSWLVRPFIGSPNAPFQFFRGAGGSLYQELARSVWHLLLSLF